MILPIVRSLLMADAGVQAIAGDRVHVSLRPQDETDAAVVLHLISDTSRHHMTGPSGWSRGTLQVDAWAPTVKQAHDLTAAIKAVLDGHAADPIAYIEHDSTRAMPGRPASGQATAIFGVSADYRFALKTPN